MDENVDIAIGANLAYFTSGKSDSTEDSFTFTTYWNGNEEVIPVTTIINQKKSSFGPEIRGTLQLTLTHRLQDIAAYALNYGSKKASSDDIVYTITEEPVWGMIELKVGYTYSPLGWRSTFTQTDIDNNLIRYHYYGGQQENSIPDILGFEVEDESGNKVSNKLQIEIKLEPEVLALDYESDRKVDDELS